MKAIKQSQLRDITDAYDREDISYSKMNEMLNLLSDKHALGFCSWYWINAYEYPNSTDKELLEIYKKTL